MSQDLLYHRLRELSWRRKLTDAEEAELRTWLAAHPEAQPDWEVEAGLNEALEGLPDAPVASNFTARVLQAVELEAAREARRPGWTWRVWEWPVGWLPKAALAALLLGAGFFSYEHTRPRTPPHRAEYIQRLAEVSADNPAILEDFDTIRALNRPAPPDRELLALLK